MSWSVGTLIGNQYVNAWDTSGWAPLTDSTLNGTSHSDLVISKKRDSVLFTGSLESPVTLLPVANSTSYTGFQTTGSLGWNLTATDGLILGICGYDATVYTVTLSNQGDVNNTNGTNSTAAPAPPDMRYSTHWSFPNDGSGGPMTNPNPNSTMTKGPNSTAVVVSGNPNSNLNSTARPQEGEEPPPPHVLMGWDLFQTVERSADVPLLDLGNINKISFMVRSDTNQPPLKFNLCLAYIGVYTHL